MITYYVLRKWGLRDQVVIERQLPEYANAEIVHNVEFSLHRLIDTKSIETEPMALPISAAKLKRVVPELQNKTLKTNQILSRDRVKRNSCILEDSASNVIIANLDALEEQVQKVTISWLDPQAYAIFECKRVGVEEGNKKGPQTIEKAKQGAYVASNVSSLQKIRLRDGTFQGIYEQSDGQFLTGPYWDLLGELINETEAAPRGLILTVGVVSNHGNWFTSDDPNKELKVLAQSYDWLLFLTDSGLSTFIGDLLLKPSEELKVVGEAFRQSYTGRAGSNRFTKVRIDAEADLALSKYFEALSDSEVESWFNVLSPRNGNLQLLRSQLQKLAEQPVV